MRLAGTGDADKDRIALGVQEGAGGEFANLPFIDRRIGEDELFQIFENRELGTADAIADRAGLPMRTFGSDQAGDERVDLIAPGKTFTGNLSAAFLSVLFAARARRTSSGVVAREALQFMAG